MSLPIIRAKSSKDLAQHFASQLEELEGQVQQCKDIIKEKTGTLKLLFEKKSNLKTDVDKMVKLYAMQRKLKFEIAVEKKTLEKLEDRIKRAQKRNMQIELRQGMFENLHIDVLKGLEKVHALQKVDFYDEEVKDEFINKRFDIAENTRIRIDYLKSQEKNRMDEINKAQLLREQRLRRKGLASSLPRQG